MNKQFVIRAVTAALVLAVLLGSFGILTFADTKKGVTFTSSDLYQTSGPLAAFPHTWEAWIKVDKDAPSGRLGVVAGGFGGASANAGLEINTNGRPDLWWCDGDGFSQHNICPDYDIRTGEWTFLAVTNTESEIKFYINGELIKTLSVSLPVISDGKAGRIGLGGDLRDGNAQYIKNSALSSVALYKNVRTAEQIKSDYKSFDYTDASALGMWDISVSGSERLNDLSKAGSNLVYKNTADPSKNEPKDEPVKKPDEGLSFGAEPIYKSSKPFSATPNTFEATLWLPADLGSTRGGIIVGNYGSVNPCVNFEVSGNGAPRLYWVNAAGKVIDVVFTGVNVLTGKWVNLAIVRDAESDTALCYIDGVLRDTKAMPDSDDVIISTPFVLGGDLRGGNGQAFRGKLKNVAVYSDMRTADEISGDFAAPGRDKNDLLCFYDLENAGENPEAVKDGGNGGYDLKGSYSWLDKPANDEEFAYSFAIVGDTQIMNMSYPEGYFGIYDWILSNVESKKIKCVMGLGDITNNNSDEEWRRAQTVMDRMNGKVPFTMVRGNHDSVGNFNKYMKTDANLAQIEEMLDSSIDNAYRTLKVGDTDYLIFVLEYGARDKTLEWAGKIIDGHPDHKVIITTHCYLFRDGTTLDDGDVVPPSKDAPGQGLNDGDDMWEKFVSKHENIVMVISGHDPCSEVVMTPAKGEKGNTVCQFLIDPQGVDASIPNGAGLVALLCFSEDGSRCRVEYYSTVKGKYYLDENQFIFDLNTGERVDRLNVEKTVTTADTAASGETTDENAGENGKNVLAIIVPCVLAAVLIAAAVIVLLVVKKKK